MNAAKCKVLVSECWADPTAVMAEGAEVEVVEDFCYLGNYTSNNGNCNKECSTRIGKASSVFGRLKNIWRNKNISLAIKVRLYESLVLSTLLYSSELWPLSVTQTKKLEAAHHKFQRRLLGISWKDKVKDNDIRKKTGLRKLKDIIKERRLRWLGHVLRMEDSRTPNRPCSGN